MIYGIAAIDDSTFFAQNTKYVITIDILVIYGLLTYGGHQRA